ncbi:YraN family protein [Lishizhenia sp.]|uniref:YraN family protein n=1 Tax=Lishizhenia sp. TaxID=2497594 RepID=UPI00299D87A8|nr:YraN family protein [Lishizhenia sp.]MDX1446259.1 YraN family protein [Lishizhenia sp.]
MNQILGKIGEDLAVEYLLNKGYKLIDRNYRFGRNEVDIIVADENQIIFVEVKTRNNNNIGEPYQAVTRKKQRQIIKVAHNFIVENEVELEARLDVISIVLNQKEKKIEHIEAAFHTI